MIPHFSVNISNENTTCTKVIQSIQLMTGAGLSLKDCMKIFEENLAMANSWGVKTVLN
jgi:hypothetical protein